MFDSSAHVLVKADSIILPGKGFVAGRSLIIKDGIIEDISVNESPAPKMRVLDYTGYTISPPFCDYHLHFFKSGLDKINEMAASLASCGVSKVFESGDGNLSGIKIKDALHNQPGINLTIKTSGFAIYKKGGYGDFLGKGAGDAGQAKLLTDELASLGVDFVKVINSGIFLPETGLTTRGGFEKDELARIIGYANDKGLPVVCHANGNHAVRDAVAAGASAIVHGFFASDETLSMMAEKGVDFIPTINALFSLTKKTIDPEAAARIHAMVNEHLDTVKRAADRGVKVLPGSDSGPDFIPYGTAFLEELKFLKKAGLADEAILSAAVATGLAPGLKANFLVLDGLSVKKVFFSGGVV